MLLTFVLPLTSLPAVLVSLVGIWFLTLGRQADQARSRILFLLWSSIVMTLPLAVFAGQVRTGGIGMILILEIPALIGVLALLLLNWRDLQAGLQAEPGLVSALLLALAALLGLMAWGDPFLPPTLITLALLVAIVWGAGQRLGLSGLFGVGLLLAMFLALETGGLLGSHRVYATPWLRATYKIATSLAMVLLLVVAALLIDRGLQAGRSGDRRRSRLYLGLVFLLGLGLAGVTFRHGLMVNASGHAAEDHMPFGVAGLGAVVGILMALGLQGRRSRLGLAYALLVPAVISLAYPAGWLVNPQAVTTARAERIDQAIGRFHQDTGAYPASLEELTPGYLSFVGAPLTGHGQVWCYQGGPDYYRLGYAFYQRYYGSTFPEPFYEIRVHNMAGQPPPGPWMCDAELEFIRTTAGL